MNVLMISCFWQWFFCFPECARPDDIMTFKMRNTQSLIASFPFTEKELCIPVLLIPISTPSDLKLWYTNSEILGYSVLLKKTKFSIPAQKSFIFAACVP